MPWAKLDDNLHANDKMAQVSLAATGLWTLALSWTAQQLKDGFVPLGILRRFAGVDLKNLADELVSAGLWVESEGGYTFHDYLEYNPAAVETIAHTDHVSEVRREAGRRGGVQSVEAKRKQIQANVKQSLSKTQANVKQNSSPDPEPMLIDKSISSPLPPQANREGPVYDPSKPLPVEVQNFVESKHAQSKDWERELRLELSLAPSLGEPGAYMKAILKRWEREGLPQRTAPPPSTPYHDPNVEYRRQIQAKGRALQAERASRAGSVPQ